jgi:hypothetical protein
MTRTALARVAATVCGGLLIVPACSSSGGSAGPPLPSAAAFAPGPCHQAAPALLAIVRRAEAGGQVGRLDTDLTAQQAVLRRLHSQPSNIQDVVTAIGFLRLRVDAHSYDDQARKDVGTAARRAVTGCTAAAR